ncbi:hypothetical protein K2X40_05140 [Candidatus Babeliales bacterium]|nr:hypothetical protein [Candidatus Babeliales bacterium]MBY0353523.1 hypothetical protein [Candidatus Babeliales bacterium]
MIIHIYLGVFLLFWGSFGQVMGYQADERLVINERATSDVFAEKPAPAAFEKKPDKSDSAVVAIEGLQAYQAEVLKASLEQPVVLKIYSNKSSESKKMIPVFQKVAEKFNSRVKFASMDLLSEQDTNKENYHIVFNLMAMLHIRQMNMPVFVFFFKGNLHLPAPIIQGFLTEENLEDQIKTRFFS